MLFGLRLFIVVFVGSPKPFTYFTISLLYFIYFDIFTYFQLHLVAMFRWCVQGSRRFWMQHLMMLTFPTAVKVSLVLPLPVAWVSCSAKLAEFRTVWPIVSRLWFSTIAVWRDHTEVLYAERGHLEERFSTWMFALTAHHPYFPDTAAAWHRNNQLQLGGECLIMC